MEWVETQEIYLQSHDLYYKNDAESEMHGLRKIYHSQSLPGEIITEKVLQSIRRLAENQEVKMRKSWDKRLVTIPGGQGGGPTEALFSFFQSSPEEFPSQQIVCD